MLVTLTLQSQKEDLNNLFGFKTTGYLRKICKVELSACPNTGTSRCFAYVTVPYHIYTLFLNQKPEKLRMQK